ncbi:membrane autotransporter barrel domain protein [Moniliophthora roreri]|nr:membrane autotransporter barrel domain protein [Moniliophthora roreri]
MSEDASRMIMGVSDPTPSCKHNLLSRTTASVRVPQNSMPYVIKLRTAAHLHGVFGNLPTDDGEILVVGHWKSLALKCMFHSLRINKPKTRS